MKSTHTHIEVCGMRYVTHRKTKNHFMHSTMVPFRFNLIKRGIAYFNIVHKKTTTFLPLPNRNKKVFDD